MSIFRVFTRPARDTKNQFDGVSATETAMVREGFSFAAMVFTPIWAMANGLWLFFFVWLVLVFNLVLFSSFLGGDLTFWLYILAATYIGFEAPTIKSMRFKGAGFAHQADLIAVDNDHAELEWHRLAPVLPVAPVIPDAPDPEPVKRGAVW